MSANLDTLDTRCLLATAIPPSALTASLTGSSFELPDGDGPVFALISVGAKDEEATMGLAFEESDAGSSWSAVAGSAVTNLAEEELEISAIAKAKRYLRCVVTLTGATPTATLGVVVGQRGKVF